MNDALLMAKWYLEIGWSLIPIVPDTKKPPIKWSQFQERHPTIVEVSTWLRNGWYLAVVTGDISGIVVVDDDRSKHGLQEWGFESSISSKTQNNGKHFFFKYDRELHSHSNPELRIDLKAWHSYALLPPFNNREWINKPSKENLVKLSPLDDDTVRLICSDTKLPNGEAKPIVFSDLLEVKDGARNDNLHRLACSLFTKMSPDDALRLLIGANQTYQPPLSQKEFDYQVSRAKEFVGTKDRYINLTRSSRVARERLVIRSTGFKKLDEIIKEIRSGGSYLFAGEEKSGKSALLLNIIAHWVKLGYNVLYGSTELQESDAQEYLTGITGNSNWIKQNSKFQFTDLLNLEGFDKHLQFLEEKLSQGTRICIIDNLTSYRDFNELPGKSEWEKISYAGDAFRRLAHKWNAIFLLVLHLNQGGRLREMPRSVKHMIVNNEPEKIFSESVSVYRRPDTSDIKGGSGFRSQTYGQFLLWRPYQQFGATNLNKLSLLIVENNRWGKTGDVFLEFDGATKTFIDPSYTDFTSSYDQATDFEKHYLDEAERQVN